MARSTHRQAIKGVGVLVTLGASIAAESGAVSILLIVGAALWGVDELFALVAEVGEGAQAAAAHPRAFAVGSFELLCLAMVLIGELLFHVHNPHTPHKHQPKIVYERRECPPASSSKRKGKNDGN